jgi:hypothetical protein
MVSKPVKPKKSKEVKAAEERLKNLISEEGKNWHP